MLATTADLVGFDAELTLLQVLVSSHNSLGGGRYFDVESSSSFAFDHTTQVRIWGSYINTLLNSCTESECCAKSRIRRQSISSCASLPLSVIERNIADCCRKSISKSLSSHVQEHYPSASYGVYPIENDSKIAIVLVANKYSPNNFWFVSSPLPVLSLLTSIGTAAGAPFTSTTPPPLPYLAI